jgi:hypothetical protein
MIFNTHGVRLSPKVNLDNLVALLNGEVWPYLLIKDDEQRIALVEIGAIIGATGAGRRIARLVRQEHPGKKPLDILQALNVKVILTKENPYWGSRMQCAEYKHRPPMVTIYEVAMANLASFAEKNSLNEFSDMETMREISLSHELYHHLERSRFPQVSSQFRLVASRFGPFTFYKKNHQLDEISAHAFAQELLDLTLNPSILNILRDHLKEESRAELLNQALLIKHNFRSPEYTRDL